MLVSAVQQSESATCIHISPLFWISFPFMSPQDFSVAQKDFPVAQTVKNLPAMQETRVQSLGREDPLKKGMAIHSSILAWRIPWTEEPGGLQSIGLQKFGCG